jgi:hypothetical protein
MWTFRDLGTGGVLTILLAAIALGIGMAYWWRLRDPVEGGFCRALYRRAHSAVDSQIVDARLPPLQRTTEYTGPIPTCGDLRKLGKVR